MFTKENPFKGPQSYQEGDSFFGRQREIYDLYNLVRLNTLTLFYARSGHGKTSLIQAGLMPELRSQKEFLPVYIRLNESAVKSLKLKSFAGFVIARFREEIEKFRKDWFTVQEEKIFNTDSIFETIISTGLKVEGDADVSTLVIPVLIFDQFEEIFSREFEEGSVSGLLEEIAFLLNNQVPPALNDELGKEENRSHRIRILDHLKSKNKKFRILFSFREEYIPYFESLPELPPIMASSRYRLEAFTEQVARKVVLEISEETISATQAEIICGELARKQTPLAQNESVEPFLLSLACFSTYPELIKSDGGRSAESIKNLVKNAIDNYVDSILGKISPVTRAFIENKLITSEGKRTPYSYLEAVNQCSKEEIDALIDVPETRLLSRQQYLDSLHIEVLHDRLASSIFLKKKEKEDLRLKQAIEANRKKYAWIGCMVLLAGAGIIVLGGWWLYGILTSKNEKELLSKQDSLSVYKEERIKDSLTSASDYRALVQYQLDSSKENNVPLTRAASRYISGIAIFQVSNDMALTQLKPCTDSLKHLGYVIQKPEIIADIKFDNRIKYYHDGDLEKAKQMISVCDWFYDTTFELKKESNSKVRAGRIEIWVNYEPYFEQMFSTRVEIRKSAGSFIASNYKNFPKWPSLMADQVMANSNNDNGVYNTLYVLVPMDKAYLMPHKDKLEKMLRELSFTNRPKSKSLADALAAKLK